MKQRVIAILCNISVVALDEADLVFGTADNSIIAAGVVLKREINSKCY